MKGSENQDKKLVEINAKELQEHVSEVVRGTVEETLNAMLDAEADAIVKAEKYERSPDRADTRAGYYNRKLETKAGKVELKVPRLRNLPFESAIIQRYKRREISVEEALVEMYLAGVSVRRVEDITEALWGTKVSPGTLSNLNKKVYENIEKWRKKALPRPYVYVYLDGIYLKRSWAGEVNDVAVLVAIGVDSEGYRDIIGVAEGAKEDKASWSNFLSYLKDKGLRGTELFISDKSYGLVESLKEHFPKARWQRCIVHFYRNIFSVVPKSRVRNVASMLKAIHAQEDRTEARAKAKTVVSKLRNLKMADAANKLENGIDETLSYMHFPEEHWKRIRTNNPLERIMREIRRRTRVVGCFPDGESALMLVAARLRYIASSKWGERRYLTMPQSQSQRDISA